MNKYIICFGVVALCLSLAGATTRDELEHVVHAIYGQVQAQEAIGITKASRQAQLRATTPQKKACIGSKVGAAHRDLNLALKRELIAVQNEYRSYTEEQIQGLDLLALIELIRQRYLAASTAQASIEQINQC